MKNLDRKFHPDNKTVDKVYNPMAIGELYNCDRCGWTWHKKELIKQNGFLVCRDCWDEPTNSQYK